jgi:hypothetical protein
VHLKTATNTVPANVNIPPIIAARNVPLGSDCELPKLVPLVALEETDVCAMAGCLRRTAGENPKALVLLRPRNQGPKPVPNIRDEEYLGF